MITGWFDDMVIDALSWHELFDTYLERSPGYIIDIEILSISVHDDYVDISMNLIGADSGGDEAHYYRGATVTFAE